MIRIDIKLFDLPAEKRAETLECFIELNKKYLRYKAEYYSSQIKNAEDVSMGWEDTYNNWDLKIKKDALVSVEKYWDNKHNYWRIEIESFGYPNVIKLYFEQEDEDEMYRVLTLLTNYIF